MKNVLFITNIPAPYRIDFYNELGKYVDLTVLFEAKGASNQGIKFNWNLDSITNFKAIFLSKGDIQEKRVNWKIMNFLRYHKFDITVVTSYSYFTEMVALLYLKMLHIPYYMETDGGLIRNENKLKKWYKTFLIKGAVGYFSPSSQSDKYLEYYGAKCGAIYRYPFTSLTQNSILTKVVDQDEKEFIRKNLKLVGKKIVLGVGQMICRKGWDILIVAAAKTDSEVHFYIVGGNPTKEYLELIDKYNIKERIHFIPFATSDVLSEYYKASDIFVLPTREDIWGLVINEALAYSLPVITTINCVAGLELIHNNENGRLVDVDAPDDLAKSIMDLLYSGSYDKMAEQALESIRNHTIEEMAKIHYEIFEKQ